MPAGGESPRTSRFVISRVGECSFCGTSDFWAVAFAGMAGRAHHICVHCLGLCLEILDDDPTGENPNPRVAQLASFDPRRELYERLFPAFESGDVDAAREVMRDFGYPDVDPDQIRAFLTPGQHPRACSVAPRQPAPAAENACSFCDSARDEVARLIPGPAVTGVKICDRCTSDAAADMLAALQSSATPN